MATWLGVKTLLAVVPMTLPVTSFGNRWDGLGLVSAKVSATKILGKKVLARVHDAIFIDTNLSNYDRQNIEFKVRGITGIDYITLDKEKLKGFKGVSALVQKEEAEQKSLIAAQALLAQKNLATS